MFGKYTDIVGTKNFLDAIGFYLFFTIFFVGLSSVLVHILGVVGIVEGIGGMLSGISISTLVGSAWVLFLSSMIVNKKGLKDLLSIVLLVLGTYLAYDMGVIVGMIPVTILTMLKKA